MCSSKKVDAQPKTDNAEDKYKDVLNLCQDVGAEHARCIEYQLPLVRYASQLPDRSILKLNPCYD